MEPQWTGHCRAYRAQAWVALVGGALNIQENMLQQTALVLCHQCVLFLVSSVCFPADAALPLVCCFWMVTSSFTPGQQAVDL